MSFMVSFFFFFFKQKTAYEMRISDWSSDVCSSDLVANAKRQQPTRDRPCCIGECDWKMTPQRLRPALIGVRDVRRPPAFTAKDARGQCQRSVYEEGRGRQEQQQDRKSTRLNSSH